MQNQSYSQLFQKELVRVRNMPTAAHTKEMLDQAIAIYEKVGKEMGII